MLFTTVFELKNFLGFLLLSVIYFVLSYIALLVSYDNSDYPGINNFFIVLIQSYRNAIGDTSAPEYNTWLTDQSIPSY